MTAEHPVAPSGRGLNLIELARELPGGARMEGDGAVRVTGVQQDSRYVQPGDLFVARAGGRAHGGTFIAGALDRGAVAVLCDGAAVVPTGVPVLRVDDPARALAYASSAVYGHPSFGMDLVGITGTNGKTTTSHLVRAAIDGAVGAPSCGLVGTVGHVYDGLQFEARHTTPEPDELARILSAMRAKGAGYVAMEVSSIAVSTGRVRALRFRLAAFTNLTQDHLDFHGTMERYAAAKAELFTELSPGGAVINVDDPFGRELAGRTRCPTLRVSAAAPAAGADGGADVAPTHLRLSESGIEARFRTPKGEVELISRLLGGHNVQNLAVALGVACALDLDVGRASAALGNEPGAAGRLERCEDPKDDVIVLVDYAHTPDALARALDAVRPITRGRLLCVFGCGGDRDPMKRAPMGDAAARGADVAIVTSDNPRGEEPGAIAASVVEGLRAGGAPLLAAQDLQAADRGYLVVLDRAEAVRLAVVAARPGDVVLIAGKGHETYQIVGAERRYMDDRILARHALAARRRRVDS